MRDSEFWRSNRQAKPNDQARADRQSWFSHQPRNFLFKNKSLSGFLEDFARFPANPLEGIDPHVDGTEFDIWFESGDSITVKADALVYLRWSDASRLAGGNKAGRAQ